MNFWVLAFGFAAAAVVIGMVATRIVLSREEVLVEAGNKAQQLARILEAGVSGTLQSAEILLDAAAAEAKARREANVPGDIQISASLKDIAADWAFVQSISFVGTDGRIVDAAVRDNDGRFQAAFQNYDISDNETFTSHARSSSANDKLYISKVRNGYITQRPVVVVTKGAWTTAGEFVGVASVAIRMAEFERLFAGLLPEVDGTISLFRLDGTLLVSTSGPNLAGRQTYKRSLLFFGAAREAASGVYTVSATDDGVGRRLAYQVGTRYPFVIAVGLPIGDVLAEWRRSSAINAGAAIFGALVICSLSIGLAIWIRRQRAAQIELIKSDESFAESQRLSGIGHFERDLQTREYTW
ncbi:MAG: hypothetical protein KDA71_07240, partial [Planctomycetales bacterium]|nr:hypothetical protein [Planctomycetales bacterium]